VCRNIQMAGKRRRNTTTGRYIKKIKVVQDYTLMLTNDPLKIILGFLNPKDMAQCMSVNKRIGLLARDPEVWKNSICGYLGDIDPETITGIVPTTFKDYVVQVVSRTHHIKSPDVRFVKAEVEKYFPQFEPPRKMRLYGWTHPHCTGRYIEFLMTSNESDWSKGITTTIYRTELTIGRSLTFEQARTEDQLRAYQVKLCGIWFPLSCIYYIRLDK
jgi:hypothetical protein